MKKSPLYYIIFTITVIVVIGIVALIVIGFVQTRSASKNSAQVNIPTINGEPIESEQAAQNFASYNSSESYGLSSDGTTVTTQPGSPQVALEINGSAQPIKLTEPATFTLSWNIDPSLILSECQIYGPTSGGNDQLWGMANNVLKTQTGTMEFEDVITASSSNPGAAKIYQGVASFHEGSNIFELRCPNSHFTDEDKSVTLWID